MGRRLAATSAQAQAVWLYRMADVQRQKVSLATLARHGGSGARRLNKPTAENRTRQVAAPRLLNDETCVPEFRF